MSDRREQRVELWKKNRIYGIELLVDNVHDPHNVAAVARSAEALGITKIYLHYTYNPFPCLRRQGHRSSASAIRWVEFEKIQSSDFFVKKKQEGVRFLATCMHENSKRIDHMQFPDRCIIMMGSEHYGLSPELFSVADEFITVPMAGMVESYNISVAASIIMYEIFRQKGAHIDVEGIRALRGQRCE